MNEPIQTNKYLSTEKFAEIFGVKSDTVRRNLCLKGNFLGLVPIKLSNRRLLWPAISPEQLAKEARQ